jgi:hypothetical protein
MATLKVKKGDEWVQVLGGGGNIQAPRAWISSGATTYGQPIQVLDSFNVSSVVYQSGWNKVNFAEPFETELYAAVGTPRENDTTSNILTLIFRDDLFTVDYASYITCRRNASTAAWTQNISIGLSASFYETRND